MQYKPYTWEIVSSVWSLTIWDACLSQLRIPHFKYSRHRILCLSVRHWSSLYEKIKTSLSHSMWHHILPHLAVHFIHFQWHQWASVGMVSIYMSTILKVWVRYSNTSSNLGISATTILHAAVLLNTFNAQYLIGATRFTDRSCWVR